MTVFLSLATQAATPLPFTTRPLRPIPAKAAVLESGRQAAESLSATIGGWQALHPRKSGDRFAP